MANVIFDWIKRNWELYYNKKNIVYSGRCYFPLLAQTVTCSTDTSEIFAPIVNSFNPKIVCIVKSIFFITAIRCCCSCIVFLFWCKEIMHCVLSIYHWWKKNLTNLWKQHRLLHSICSMPPIQWYWIGYYSLGKLFTTNVPSTRISDLL